MTILNLVGLISLLGLVMYFVLYFIKPNYQQKFVSSTYIWKLSLKYKKKRIPISKLRNILLVICQVLLLITLTIIIIKPAKVTKQPNENESILIIDASASMRTTDDLDTRFERAVDLARRKANDILNKDGLLSIVVSTNDPYFLVERETKENINSINLMLDELVEEESFACTYGKTDLNKSIDLCNDILLENSSANITIYSDVTADYIDKGITLVNVRKQGEYNIAITNAYSDVLDNYYMFTVEVVSYGKDESIELTLEVAGANANESNPTGSTIEFSQIVDLVNDEPKKVIFINSSVDLSTFEESPNIDYYQISDDEKIITYESAHVSTNTEDSFVYDNSFDIYGGTKETIKVLYASSSSNSFFNGVILVLESALSNRYTIELTKYKPITGSATGSKVPNSGYDLYIYEHSMMPTTSPTDGIVIYADPQTDVIGAGFSVLGNYDYNKVSMSLTEEETHPIIDGLVADNITVSKLVAINGYRNYKVLMSCDSRPAIMIDDSESTKNIVLLFSMHYSNLALLKDFPLLMYNIFNYFLPQTVDGHSFEINDSVAVNSRGNSVDVTGYGNNITLDSFPATVSLTIPGTYEVSQISVFGKEINDNIYVRIPADESNILLNVDSITNPVSYESLDDIYEDLLLWISIALVSFLFLEWLLKGKDTL